MRDFLFWSIVAGIIAFVVLFTLAIVVPILLAIGFRVPIYSGV